MAAVGRAFIAATVVTEGGELRTGDTCSSYTMLNLKGIIT